MGLEVPVMDEMSRYEEDTMEFLLSLWPEMSERKNISRKVHLHTSG